MVSVHFILFFYQFLDYSLTYLDPLHLKQVFSKAGEVQFNLFNNKEYTLTV